MTVEPPFATPGLQVNEIDVEVLEATVSERLMGASAYVIMIAPLPTAEVAESP